MSNIPISSSGKVQVPTRSKSLTEHINAFGLRITRMISKESETTGISDKRNSKDTVDNSSSYSYFDEDMKNQEADLSSLSSSPTMTDAQVGSRSRSRGRELHSSGRGGAGNILHSVPDLTNPVNEDESRSFSRGRDRFVSTGRGGAGNIRSPSKDANAAVNEHERVIERHEHDQNKVLSTGRGGAGNITTPPRSTSRDQNTHKTNGESRSASRGRMLHSSGRGGAGNIVISASEAELERLEDLERLEHRHPEGIHSTGRGGAANMTRNESPAPERFHPHAPIPGHLHNGQEYVSSGRGGAGNIRSRSQSRDVSGSRNASKEAAHKDKNHPHGHTAGKVFDKIFHHDHQSGSSHEIPSVTE